MPFGQFYFLVPYFWLIDVQAETRDECLTMTGILPVALQFGVQLIERTITIGGAVAIAV